MEIDGGSSREFVVLHDKKVGDFLFIYLFNILLISMNIPFRS